MRSLNPTFSVAQNIYFLLSFASNLKSNNALKILHKGIHVISNPSKISEINIFVVSCIELVEGAVAPVVQLVESCVPCLEGAVAELGLVRCNIARKINSSFQANFNWIFKQFHSIWSSQI